jgi:hypothetical protein
MAKKESSPFAEMEEVTTQAEPVIATPKPDEGSGLKQVRVKGTWRMYWGQSVYNFVDGSRYNLAEDLISYLKKNGNIYDTAE